MSTTEDLYRLIEKRTPAGSAAAIIAVIALAGFGSLPALAQSAGLFHTIRYRNGTWDAFGDVMVQTSQIGGPALQVGVAGGGNGELHVVTATGYYGGNIYHTIRYLDGHWQRFGDVKQQAGNPGYFLTVAAALIADNLHVAGVTSDGRVWHTIRYADGHWDGFGDVIHQSGNAGRFSKVAVAGDPASGDLHLTATTYGGTMFHAIRHANGQWDRFGDVVVQAGNPGLFNDVAIGLIGGSLHVAGVTNDGKVVHTIRYPSGKWDRFAAVHGQVTLGRIHQVTLAGDNGADQLHMAVINGGSRVYHTIRYANGRWDPFGDVTRQAGNPGSPNDAGLAVISGTLHLAISRYCCVY